MRDYSIHPSAGREHYATKADIKHAVNRVLIAQLASIGVIVAVAG